MASILTTYNDALRLIGSDLLATTTDDLESRFVLDEAWTRSILFVLRQASWRHALVTESLTGTTGSVIPGFTYKFSKPANWLRTNAIFVVSGTRECPIDVKDQGILFYAHLTPIVLRYVTSAAAGIDPALWPEHFAKTLAAYLAFQICERLTGDANKTASLFQFYENALSEAMVRDAMPESSWLRHQLSGKFAEAARFLLNQGFWRFAVKQLSNLAATAGTTLAEFTFGFDKPADWLQTMAIYSPFGNKELPIDVREHEARWSADVATINVKYLSSTSGMDAALWPNEFREIAAAYLEMKEPVSNERGETKNPIWVEMLQVALSRIADPVSPWLRHQLDGSFIPAVRYVLEQHAWHFAIKTTSLTGSTTTPSAGFTYRFTRPTDWLRSSFLYYPNGSIRDEVEFREEGGYFHANTTPLVVRYISKTLGEDASLWSDAFEHTLLAYLKWREVMTQPDVPGAVMQARAMAYQAGLKNAKAMDDMRERPRVNRTGTWIASRGGLSREQGLY